MYKEVDYMKKLAKVFTLFFLIVIMFSFCSCKSKNKISTTSSIPTTTQNTRTLLLAMTASDNLDNIGGIRIVSSSCTIGSPIISNKNDMEFLQNYTYSHSRTTKKALEQQLLKDRTNYSFEVVTPNGSKYFLYLMQDGSIATKQMCGDSGVADISYDFYTADKKDILTKEKLELLLNTEK
jgi:hypothetical protein